MVRHLVKKDINRCFTAGEEAILEQACMIIKRRKSNFVSKHFEGKEVLSLVNDKDKFDMIKEFEHIYRSADDFGDLAQLLGELRQKYIKEEGGKKIWDN